MITPHEEHTSRLDALDAVEFYVGTHNGRIIAICTKCSEGLLDIPSLAVVTAWAIQHNNYKCYGGDEFGEATETEGDVIEASFGTSEREEAQAEPETPYLWENGPNV